MERGAFHINNQENRLRQTKQEDEKRKTLPSITFKSSTDLLIQYLMLVLKTIQHHNVFFVP